MYKRILVPIDLQENDRPRTLALKKAVEICRLSKGELYVLTVVPDMGMPIVAQYFPSDAGDKIVAEAESMLHEVVGAHIPDDVDVHHMVAQGSVHRRILRMAERIGADLIVIPAHRMKLQDYLLGTNAARVVRHARCCVLVVRCDPGDCFELDDRRSR